MSALAANSQILYREIYQRDQQQQLWINGSCLLLQTNCRYFGSGRRNRKWKNIVARKDSRVAGLWPDLSRPSTVEMEPINDSDKLDQVLLCAQQLSQPILIDWTAAWCRKCIYLKSKLEKLAAEYDTKIKFYYVDVNKVPQGLAKRGNISKMPTIQSDKEIVLHNEEALFVDAEFFDSTYAFTTNRVGKDGEMKDEVIGGHRAWLVIEEVRQMIKNLSDKNYWG